MPAIGVQKALAHRGQHFSVGMMSKKMSKVADAAGCGEWPLAEAHVRHIDKTDVVIGSENDIAKMYRPEIDARSVENIEKKTQLVGQSVIDRRADTVVAQGNAVQGLIVNGRALYGRYSIDRRYLYSGDVQCCQPVGIIAKAFDIGEKARRRY